MGIKEKLTVDALIKESEKLSGLVERLEEKYEKSLEKCKQNWHLIEGIGGGETLDNVSAQARYLSTTHVMIRDHDLDARVMSVDDAAEWMDKNCSTFRVGRKDAKKFFNECQIAQIKFGFLDILIERYEDE